MPQGSILDGSDDEREDNQKSSERTYLIDLIEAHDINTNEFYEVLKSISKTPSMLEEAQGVVAICGRQIAESWANIVAKLGGDHGMFSEEFTKSIATLWLHDEVERTKLLQEIGPEAKYSPICEGDITNVTAQVQGIQELAEDDEQILEMLVSGYLEFVNIDLVSFKNAIQSRSFWSSSTEPEPETIDYPNIESLKHRNLGSHVLDVLKIAAGVSLGILIGRKFGHKKP